MNLSFKIAPDGFLKVDASGRADVPGSLKMARQIAEYDGGAQKLPILLDVRRVRGTLSTLDMVRLVNMMLAEAGRYRRKLALLVRGDGQIERAQFMQNYSSNRGIPIGAFADYDDAIRWLKR